MTDHQDVRKGTEFQGPCVYRLLIQGKLDPAHARRLGGLQLTEVAEHAASEAVTTFVGRLRDQTELNGVLQSVHDLHLTILSLEALEEGESGGDARSPAEGR